MKFVLRDYQERGARSVLKKQLAGEAICVVAPQGSGKTPMIARVTQLARSKKMRVLIVCYRREAVFQTMEHLGALGLDFRDVGLILHGYEYHKNRPIQVATWTTLIRRDLPPADVVILDEAHHAVCDSYEGFTEHYGREKGIGFSATPYRRDNRGLSDAFDDLMVAAQPSDLIPKGWLGNPRIFTGKTDILGDLTKIKKAANGDFAPGELQTLMDNDELTGNIISHWKKEAHDRRTLVFGVGIDHSMHLAERFKKIGVSVGHVDSTMHPGPRDEVLADFRAGRIQVLCNCMILSESFDLPACQAVVLARPTSSFALAMQQAGRGMRAYGNQRPIILDHALNCIRFGLPQSDRDHQLTDTLAVIESGGAVKVCPECGETWPAGTAQCSCGYTFTLTERTYMPGESQGSLREIQPAVIHAIRKRVQDYGAENGHDSKWARKVMRTLSLDI